MIPSRRGNIRLDKSSCGPPGVNIPHIFESQYPTKTTVLNLTRIPSVFNPQLIYAV
jgi:hypothetical protein